MLEAAGCVGGTMTYVCGDGGWKSSFRYGYSCLDLLERERRTRELAQEKEVRGWLRPTGNAAAAAAAATAAAAAAAVTVRGDRDRAR
eukprot:COSAG01_NODE_5095_length_4491_cov_3.972450_4_plen_87_part_00